MEDIKNKILDMQIKAVYLDYLKADYRFDMEILLDLIPDLESDSGLKSKDEISIKISHLINAKDALVTELIKLIEDVNELDHELHIWRHQNEDC